MAKSTKLRIARTRNIIALVVIFCIAKLIKMAYEGAETSQFIILGVAILVLGIVLLLYIKLDKYTRNEQEIYDDPKPANAGITTPPPVLNPVKGLKMLYKDMFKNNK